MTQNNWPIFCGHTG